jgi:hypothetical protein
VDIPKVCHYLQYRNFIVYNHALSKYSGWRIYSAERFMVLILNAFRNISIVEALYVIISAVQVPRLENGEDDGTAMTGVR